MDFSQLPLSGQISSRIPTAAAAVVPVQGGRVSACEQLMLSQPSVRWSYLNLPPWQLCNTASRGGGRSKRTPPRVPAVPHLLSHHAVDILGDIAGHQIDGDGANKVPAKSCVVLQTIARAVLHVGREQGGNKV